MPADFLLRTVLFMRALSGLQPDQIPQAAQTLFNAFWKYNLDIADPEVVASLVGQEALERAVMQEVKDALFKNTEEAVQRGAFSAPTFFVEDEMFFRHDRLPLLESHLQGLVLIAENISLSSRKSKLPNGGELQTNGRYLYPFVNEIKVM